MSNWEGVIDGSWHYFYTVATHCDLLIVWCP